MSKVDQLKINQEMPVLIYESEGEGNTKQFSLRSGILELPTVEIDAYRRRTEGTSAVLNLNITRDAPWDLSGTDCYYPECKPSKDQGRGFIGVDEGGINIMEIGRFPVHVHWLAHTRIRQPNDDIPGAYRDIE